MQYSPTNHLHIEQDCHNMELTSVMVVQLTIGGVSYWIIICIEWLFAPMDLIWCMMILTKILHIAAKLLWNYNPTKQVAHDFVLYNINGNSVNDKAWFIIIIIIVCNGFKKLPHVTSVDIKDLFGNANTQNKMNKIIFRCSVNDNLIVAVYGGDDECSWGINTLINKYKIYYNNLDKFITIYMTPYGADNNLLRGIRLG